MGAVSLLETTVFLDDMVAVGNRFGGSQFAFEMGWRYRNEELEGVVGIVFDPVVQIIVDDRCAAAEGDLSAVVGEQVELVMVMMFDYVKGTVQDQPVEKVGELAHAAADALFGLIRGDG